MSDYPTGPGYVWKLIPLIQQVLTKVGVHRTKTGLELNLTHVQLSILGTIYQQENCTMSEVAQEHYIVPSAATRLVDELVKKGLIERVADGQDRRVVRLKMTTQGRETIDSVHQEAFPLLAHILEKMSPEEQEALTVGLTGLLRAVAEGEPEIGDSSSTDRKD